MESIKIFLAGEMIETASTLKVYNPWSGEIFATTFNATERELDKAIQSAMAVKETLRQMPAYQRSNVLLKIRDRLIEMKETFAATISRESGKPIGNARVEVDRSIGIFTVAAEEAKRLPKEYMGLDWVPSGEGREALVKYFPIGIVAGISPFNFPLNLAVHKIAPAIAAGAPIILKPSSSTPLSTLLLAGIINETNLPKGAVSILPMDRKTGNQLVTDERISMISFTGSQAVGWKMKEQSGKKKVILELGGNAAVIVSENSNWNDAASKCVASAFSFAGQTCISTQRIFVHENIYSPFLESLKSGAEKLKLGNPLSDDTQMSVLIDDENVARIAEWVNEAKQGGAKVITGGTRMESLYRPTILTGTSNSMKVRNEEVFGPVVIVEKYSTFPEAVKMVNDSKYGLQAGVFTNLISEMYHAFNHLEVGGVIINDSPSYRSDHMPYGGVKDSGFGREGVKYAIQDMLESRVMVIPSIT